MSKTTQNTNGAANGGLTFSTLSAAAAFIPVPVSALRAVKKMGCPGFYTNGRVALLDVIGWLITRGRNVKLPRSLEESRARLADVRADVLMRQDSVANGSMVPVIWVSEVLGQQLSIPRIFMREREQRLAFMVNLSAGNPDAVSREADIQRIIADDTQTILTAWRHVEENVKADLQKGPPAGPGRTALGDFVGCIEELAALVSPAARAEMLAALERVKVKLTPATKEGV